MIYLLMAGSVEIEVPYELIPFAYGQLKALGYKQVFILRLGDSLCGSLLGKLLRRRG